MKPADLAVSAALAFVSLAAGCDHKTPPAPSINASAAPSGSAASAPSATASASPEAESPAAAKGAPISAEGQALARSPTAPVLYVADEDHNVLRRVALTDALTRPPPLADPPAVAAINAEETSIPMPGRPAQVVALADTILVTVRDPGQLVVLGVDKPDAAPREIARVALPADAWGLAVSPDLRTAYVTHAWTHKLSAVDLTQNKLKWTIDTDREPRGVSASKDGKLVYITHLVGAPITMVDVSAEPRATRITLPADPLRTLLKETVPASLGYAAILSPDGRRLYVARHALGSGGAWEGSPTVDVLSTVTNTPIAPARSLPALGTLAKDDLEQLSWIADSAGMRVGTWSGAWAQPRAIAYRKKTNHLLIASEGMSLLSELDALAVAPGLQQNRLYRLGGLTPTDPTQIQIPPNCGAPTGVVLSEDEDVAWVYCRSTDNLAAVRLTPDGMREDRSETTLLEGQKWKVKLSTWGPFAYAKLSVPAAPEDLALGRRLFYDATEPIISGGLACAGCHPEGRDDGHIWREIKQSTSDVPATFIAGPSLANTDGLPEGVKYGYARQTPMLVGRVDASGPYGWHAESATLEARIRAGFRLHRARQEPADGLSMHRRAAPLIVFLRTGLVAPPKEARDLTAEEQRGKEIFDSSKAQCATCHAPKTAFTDRSSLPLRGFKALPLFDEDPNRAYKVPSLLFVGGSPPYYHDGSAGTLEELIDKNYDRMGRTTHLTAEERGALVAYLKTL